MLPCQCSQGRFASKFFQTGCILELSPLYHKVVLEDLLRVAVTLQAQGMEEAETVALLRLQKMCDCLFSLERGASRTPLFNDSGDNVAKSCHALLSCAKKRFGHRANVQGRPAGCGVLPHRARLRQRDTSRWSLTRERRVLNAPWGMRTAMRFPWRCLWTAFLRWSTAERTPTRMSAVWTLSAPPPTAPCRQTALSSPNVGRRFAWRGALGAGGSALESSRCAAAWWIGRVTALSEPFGLEKTGGWLLSMRPTLL